MLLSAKVDVDGAEVAVVLRNLSVEGALIEGKNLPREGGFTVFKRNDLCVTGHIVWVEGRFAGLRFDRQLDREELLRQVPRPRRRFASSTASTSGERHDAADHGAVIGG